MKRAALYIRVSTEMQAQEGYSIPAQEEKLKAYVKLHEIHPVEIFIDGGYSGSNLNRPEIKRLMDCVKKGEISHVIVYKLDRLSRSQKDTLFLIEDVFLPNEVAFISINENIDTQTPYGRAMIGIMSAFAQLERENIHMRTRMGMLERVKSGFWMGGGKIPYGYDYDRNLGILVPNEDACKVQAMYQMYLDGDSPAKIAKLFGLKYDRLVTQILKRKTNLGSIVYKGEEYPGQHAPIISKEIYEKAMLKMEGLRKTNLRNGTHLLSGLCICGFCGSRMRYIKWGQNGYKLMCYSQDKSKALPLNLIPCENEKVLAADIERRVILDLLQFSIRSENEDKISDDQMINSLKKQEKQLQNKLRTLYHIYGEDADPFLLETIADCKKQLKLIEEKLLETKKQDEYKKTNKKRRSSLLKLADTWDYLYEEEKRELLLQLVEKIVIRGEESLSIYYTIS